MTKRPDANVTPNTYGIEKNAAPQEHVALSDLLALQLSQVTSDVQDQLVNNDFEKKFFEYGDTVKVVAIDPNSVKIEARNFKGILRPALDDLKFEAKFMIIDKSLAYGFKVDDLTKMEEKWNRETALTALAGKKMRETHNLKTLDLILQNKDIPMLYLSEGLDANTDANPNATAAHLFRIVNQIQMEMARKGATDRNGQYSYGSNRTVALRPNASMFIAPELKLELLNSQYTRVDDVTEGVIRDGKYEKFGGFILNQANELSTSSDIHCEALDKLAQQLSVPAGKELCAIIVGTKNLVTRASRTLPIEKQRSEIEFATKYTCMEIYGEMVAVPDAGVVVLIPVDSKVTFQAASEVIGVAATGDSLMKSMKEEMPYVNIDDKDSSRDARYNVIGDRAADTNTFDEVTGFDVYQTSTDTDEVYGGTGTTGDSDSDSDTDGN